MKRLCTKLPHHVCICHGWHEAEVPRDRNLGRVTGIPPVGYHLSAIRGGEGTQVHDTGGGYEGVSDDALQLGLQILHGLQPTYLTRSLNPLIKETRRDLWKQHSLRWNGNDDDVWKMEYSEFVWTKGSHILVALVMINYSLQFKRKARRFSKWLLFSQTRPSLAKSHSNQGALKSGWQWPCLPRIQCCWQHPFPIQAMLWGTCRDLFIC